MQKELEQELELRINEIRADAERLMRYDIDGDGIISDEEWEEVRRFVTAEITTERARSREANKPTALNSKDLQTLNASPLEVLQDRYELLQVIGQGAQGKTFLAHDRQSNQPVAIKELQMSQVEQWEAIDLFEREAKVLKSISHPAIPQFIDFFHNDAKNNHGMRSFLVQEFVDGEDLKELMEDGLLVDEPIARAFLKEMLAILDHLHSLPTPIIHSDIKLSNIIRRRDQRLALIDFGAVQFHVDDEDLPSNTRPTIIGTSGYMPIEQMMGNSVPATDLYALAATTVHLLSRRHPADLPLLGMALQFQDFVNISDPFKHILKKMLAPHLEHRFTSVNEVLQALEHTSTHTNTQQNPPVTTLVNQSTATHQPKPTTIKFGRSSNEVPTFFNTWDQSATQTEPSKDLDVPRPETLHAEFDDADGRFSLTFPREKMANPIGALITLFIVSAICSALLWIGTKASLENDPTSALIYLVIALVFLTIPVTIVREMLNATFNKASIEIADKTLYHHINGLFRVKTSPIPLEMIENVTVTMLTEITNKKSYNIPILLISNRYNVFYLGKNLPPDELDYWSAKIQQKLLAASNKPDH